MTVTRHGSATRRRPLEKLAHTVRQEIADDTNVSEGKDLSIAAGLELPDRLANLNATRIFLPSRVSAGAMFQFLIAMMTKNTLPARTRELIILRLVWLARCVYEFSHHAEGNPHKSGNDHYRPGQNLGLSLLEIMS